MKGYHYTPKNRWLKIQKEGLKKYDIKTGHRGVFVWEPPLDKRSENGNIIFQMATKNTSEIVKLEVDYEEKDILYETNHVGKIDSFYYHNKAPAVILDDIPPERIGLISEYKFEEAFK